MASERQIAANRANAKLSTGPKSAAGKLRSNRNALKHGLSIPAVPPFSAIGEDGSGSALGSDEELPVACQFELMRIQLELSRVRRIRSELIAAVLQTPSTQLIKRLGGLSRYERLALRKRKKAITNAQKLRASDKTNPI
jgi:hypothetical protein